MPIVDFDEQSLPSAKCAADFRMSRIFRIYKYSVVDVYLHDTVHSMPVVLFLTPMLFAFWWLWTWRYKTCSEHAHDKTMFCFLVNGAMETVLLPQNQRKTNKMLRSKFQQRKKDDFLVKLFKSTEETPYQSEWLST